MPSNNWFSLELLSIYWTGYVVQFLFNWLDHNSEDISILMYSIKKTPYFCLLVVLEFPVCSLTSFISLHRAGDAWNAAVNGCWRFDVDSSINQFLTALSYCIVFRTLNMPSFLKPALNVMQILFQQ